MYIFLSKILENLYFSSVLHVTIYKFKFNHFYVGDFEC